MQEDFLHYIWKYKKFALSNLKTTAQEPVFVLQVGMHNHNTGPDFFNAQIKITDQLWAGNVEIHIKSSDWFLHGHEQDANYDNVILHVVWEHDTEIHRKDNTVIATLVLKDIVDKTALQNYQKLFRKKQKWINCENDFATVDDFVVNNWLERLYFERLERKSADIAQLLQTSKNNWEAVLFKMLAKSFGLKVNGDAFLSFASSIDFTVVQKLQSKQRSLEALFFGQADLLNLDKQDLYYLALKKEYLFLKQKFGLSNQAVTPLQFFRLRPPNFPTIRISQLANLYSAQTNLFSKIINAKNIEEIYALFAVGTSAYWQTHFTFGKTSKESKKRITKAFIDLLIINTIVPIKFSYAKQQGKDIDDVIIRIINQISSEKNSIVTKFQELHPVATSAMQSQALLQLKTQYCEKNKCLQCAIGNVLLTSVV
ncbi:DUF2851 family protein [Lacinutrix sp. C3R15]|uniref:DUF2851 family protein n=1 Tax=Flavobacteriaceae TaxID=49546 RepID=UPI001C0A60D3|nr:MULTISPECIES: DUF2851 family protein [Flavobacteriaceae]MBU2939636.1 DUF2851 family protein [Lacinutrix sp. C3R15]MDO6622951.1 DUF2851 family protein [Oceanihabitans sp. 1_MG-2023]